MATAIGSLVVDLSLKSATFISYLDKAAKATVRTQKTMEGLSRTVNTAGAALGGFITTRVLQKLARVVQDSLKLASTLGGPLGVAAKNVTERFERMQAAFQLGVAKGFIDSIKGGLDQSTLSLETLAKAGVVFGNVMGMILTDIVNFFAHDIPLGVKTSVDQINSVITAYNAAAAARDAAAAKPSAMAPGAGTGLIGPGDEGQRIALIDTGAIVVQTTKIFQGYADVQGVVAASQAATTQGMKEQGVAAEIFQNIVKQSEALYANSRTPMEQYEQNLQKIKDAHATGELAARAHMQANALLAGEFLSLADTAAGALGTLFKDSKGVAIAQAVINTAQAITATLAQYGATPWGLVAAGVAAASGAAQIATIMSAQPGSSKKPSVGKGGKSKGGGGGGSSDSASPKATGSGQTMQRSMNVVINGTNFSRDQVRMLVAQMNEMSGDGLTIRTG
jgi:hypothetical protein